MRLRRGTLLCGVLLQKASSSLGISCAVVPERSTSSSSITRCCMLLCPYACMHASHHELGRSQLHRSPAQLCRALQPHKTSEACEDLGPCAPGGKLCTAPLSSHRLLTLSLFILIGTLFLISGWHTWYPCTAEGCFGTRAAGGAEGEFGSQQLQRNFPAISCKFDG